MIKKIPKKIPKEQLIPILELTNELICKLPNDNPEFLSDISWYIGDNSCIDIGNWIKVWSE